MSNQNMNQNNQNMSIFSTDHNCYMKTAWSRQRMLFDKVSENEMITKYNALRAAYFKPTAGRSGAHGRLPGDTRRRNTMLPALRLRYQVPPELCFPGSAD